jgi:hypothetical protein
MSAVRSKIWLGWQVGRIRVTFSEGDAYRLAIVFCRVILIGLDVVQGFTGKEALHETIYLLFHKEVLDGGACAR